MDSQRGRPASPPRSPPTPAGKTNLSARARHPPTHALRFLSLPGRPLDPPTGRAADPCGGRGANSKSTDPPARARPRLAMASSKAPRPRAEASAPATSVAVAAARAQDAHPLQRSTAFPPRRTHHGHSHSHSHGPPQRCDSERIGSRSRQPRCGEVAGGTAAGCAAVCCCFPCVMVEVVVLATVRAPAALCRRAVRASRRRRSASAGQAAAAERVFRRR